MADQSVAQKVAQQVKEIGTETVEELKKQPSQMADTALEQLGLKSSSGPAANNQQSTSVGDQIQQLKAQDQLKSQRLAGQIKQELETEIAKHRQIREERSQQRRQPSEEELEAIQQVKVEETIEPPASKKARGSAFRVKKAKSQAQPETVGRRVGG